MPIAPGVAVVLSCAQSAFRDSIIQLLEVDVGGIVYVTDVRIVPWRVDLSGRMGLRLNSLTRTRVILIR
jgi:hypothetical protein